MRVMCLLMKKGQGLLGVTKIGRDKKEYTPRDFGKSMILLTPLMQASRL